MSDGAENGRGMDKKLKKFWCIIYDTLPLKGLSKAQNAVLNNEQQNVLYPNQQIYSNYNGRRSNNNNNFARNSYNNFPNKNF